MRSPFSSLAAACLSAVGLAVILPIFQHFFPSCQNTSLPCSAINSGLTLIAVLAATAACFMLMSVYLRRTAALLHSGTIPAAPAMISIENLPFVKEPAASATTAANELIARLRVMSAERDHQAAAARGCEQNIRELEQTLSKLREIQDQMIAHGKRAAIAAIAGSMAHEMRNPLTSISNAIYFISKTVQAEDPRIRSTLSLIKDDIQRAEKTIALLMEYAHAGTLARATHRLDKIVENVIASAGLPPSFLLDKQLAPVEALVDQAKLTAALSAVIANAAEAAGEKGAIRISLSEHGLSALITIADNGSGIPAAEIPFVFDPLFTTKLKGMGLGLAMAKEIVDAHYGSILMESSPGEGATVSIHLPLS